jgi:hypothetical protein
MRPDWLHHPQTLSRPETQARPHHCFLGEAGPSADIQLASAMDGGCRVKGGSVRAGEWNAGMPQNFIEGRREQGFLLPPDVREWLPPDHLAWFVIDAVAEMGLSDFYAVYRADGHGRAAYEPSLMVALILYAFATGVRSSRAIERHLSPGRGLPRDHRQPGS